MNEGLIGVGQTVIGDMCDGAPVDHVSRETPSFSAISASGAPISSRTAATAAVVQPTGDPWGRSVGALLPGRWF